MKSKLFLLMLAVAVLFAVQPVQAQGYYKHYKKAYKHKNYYGRGDYGYRHYRGGDDNDQGEGRRYRRSYGYYRHMPPGQAKKYYGRYYGSRYYAGNRYYYRSRPYYRPYYPQRSSVTINIGVPLGF